MILRSVVSTRPISEGRHSFISLWRRGPVQIFVWRGPIQILRTHSQRKFRWRTPCDAALCVGGAKTGGMHAPKNRNDKKSPPAAAFAPARTLAVRVAPPISELRAELRGSLIFLPTVKSSCAGLIPHGACHARRWERNGTPAWEIGLERHDELHCGRVDEDEATRKPVCMGIF